MGENANAEKAPKKNWYKGLKVEFNKIAWPEQKSLAKQTTAVVAISIILGLIISVLDTIIKFGVDFLVK